MAKAPKKDLIASAAVPAATQPAMAKAEVAVISKSDKANSVTVTGDADEFGAMESGLENVTTRDQMIPRLGILQALSPQLVKSKPEFIKGATAGTFCDTGTGDTFEESIEIIPCFFATVFLEWAPRASGKGLVHNHGTNIGILDKCTPDDKGRNMLPNGNYIAETATYYVLNLSAGGRRSFIPLSSTQLKASRRWMTLIMAERLRRSNGTEFTPPIFYRSWKATITENSNNEGSWFGWKFEASKTILELDPTKSLLNEARNFFEQARDGLVKGDVADAAEENASAMTRDPASVNGSGKTIDAEAM